MFNIHTAEMPLLLRDYLTYILTIKGLSPRTVEGYYIDLRFFFRYIHATRNSLDMSEKNLADIPIGTMPESEILGVTISDAYAFLNFVMTLNENKANARARKVTVIRRFYQYVYDKTGKLSVNPMESLETPNKKKALPKYLTLDESLHLLKSIDGKHRERDFCMITFLLNCGMRVSELVGIKIESFSDNSLRLLGKGNKERVVYLNDACLYAKAAYDRVREEPKLAEHKNSYFLSTRGKSLTTRRVEQILEAHLLTAGLNGRGFSPHKLRHTAATLMYQHGGVDINVLKEILGHVSVGTTEIYTHVASKEIERAAHASPLAGVKLQPVEMSKEIDKATLNSDIDKENE